MDNVLLLELRLPATEEFLVLLLWCGSQLHIVWWISLVNWNVCHKVRRSTKIGSCKLEWLRSLMKGKMTSMRIFWIYPGKVNLEIGIFSCFIWPKTPNFNHLKFVLLYSTTTSYLLVSWAIFWFRARRGERPSFYLLCWEPEKGEDSPKCIFGLPTDCP